MNDGSNDRRFGIALDGTRLSIAWRNTDPRQPRWQTAIAPCDGSPSAVSRALADLAARPAAASSACVTLIRPLAHTRVVNLPHMARATLEGILARDWSRYVIGHRAIAHTVTARSATRDRWVAAFAPADLLEAIADASSSDWSALEICTSDDALAATARALAPEDARTGSCVVVLCDASGPTDATHLRRGLPWLGRRFLAGASADDVAAFVRASESAAHAPVILLGHSTRTTALARTLDTHGIRTRLIDLGLANDVTAIEAFAVAGTIGAAMLPLRSPRTLHRRSSGMRATTRWLALAAATALIAALRLDQWQVDRQLAQVQRARADIAALVRTAMSARSDVQSAADIASALAEDEASASRVSGVLAAVALTLPSGASLTAMRVAGDSVTVEGESSRSAAVYDALRAVPKLDQVKLAAPLRQERQAGDVVVEHFAFNARVRPPAAPSRGATR